MTENILKAIENAGLVHEGNKPEDHVIHSMLDGLDPLQFYEKVIQAVNPLFIKKGVEYSIRGNQLILTRNHFSPALEFKIANIVPFLKLYPITVDRTIDGGKPYSFDGNRSLLIDPRHNPTTYKGLAEILSAAAKSALGYSYNSE